MFPIFFVNKWTIPHLTSHPRRIQYMSETSIYPLKQTLLCCSVTPSPSLTLWICLQFLSSFSRFQSIVMISLQATTLYVRSEMSAIWELDGPHGSLDVASLTCNRSKESRKRPKQLQESWKFEMLTYKMLTSGFWRTGSSRASHYMSHATKDV